MNPRDAQASATEAHDRVDVVSRRGRVRDVELRITEIVAPGQVFMPFHFVETNANEVTQSAFDPISREPNYKQCAVRVELNGVQANRKEMAMSEVSNVCCLLTHAEVNEWKSSWSSETAWRVWPASNRSCVTRRSSEITIFGDETHVNYNRILLSSVLAGEKSIDDIALNGLDWYREERHRLAARRADRRRRSERRRPLPATTAA